MKNFDPKYNDLPKTEIHCHLEGAIRTIAMSALSAIAGALVGLVSGMSRLLHGESLNTRRTCREFLACQIPECQVDSIFGVSDAGLALTISSLAYQMP